MANTLNQSNTRERLFSVAVDLFAEHGYQGVGVRDIAKYMGLNPGFIYHHVESKQKLLYELVEDTLCELIAHTKLHLAAAKSDLGILKKFVEAFFSFNRDSPGRMLVLSREEYNLTLQQKVEVGSRYLEYSALLEQVLMRFFPDNEKGKARVLARTILAFLIGQIFLRGLALPDANLVEFITRLVLIESSIH